MDHLTGIAEHQIVPFLGSYDLCNFMLVSKDFYRTSKNAVQKISRNTYLFHYKKYGFDIRYEFYNGPRRSIRDGIFSYLTETLVIYNAHDTSLGNFDVYLRIPSSASLDNTRYIATYDESIDLPGIRVMSAFRTIFIWIAQNSFSISHFAFDIDINTINIHIFTRNHYKERYEKFLETILNFGLYNKRIKYGVDTLGASGITDPTGRIFLMKNMFVYPSYYETNRTIDLRNHNN